MSLPFATPAASHWAKAPSHPPDVSATPQAQLLGWESLRDADQELTLGCFGFALGGYTEELVPIVFERLEPFTVRAAGGREGPLQRAPLDRAPQERWERVQFTTHADATSRRQAIAQQAFAFADDGTLRACFAVCVAPSETSTPCEEAIASARFTFMAAPLPSPTATQQLARVLLAHPAAAGYGFLTTLGLCMLALLFARRTRFC